MDDRLREIVDLMREGLTYEEIGKRIGRSKSTVSLTISKAVRKIKKYIEAGKSKEEISKIMGISVDDIDFLLEQKGGGVNVADEDLGERVSRVEKMVEEMASKLDALLSSRAGMTIEEREYDVEGMRVRRPVSLDPAVLKYYEAYIAKGGDMNFDEWLNEVVFEHMTECLGMEYALISRPKRERGAVKHWGR